MLLVLGLPARHRGTALLEPAQAISPTAAGPTARAEMSLLQRPGRYSRMAPELQERFEAVGAPGIEGLHASRLLEAI